MSTVPSKNTRLRLAAALTAAGLLLAACGGAATSAGSGGAPPTGSSKPAAATGSGQVLPVTSNPIDNTATAKTLSIADVLVENNVDAAGKPVDDHLEITLANSGSTPLTGLEFYYTFTDPTAKASESYYAKLPADVAVPAGGTYTVNFDNSGTPGSVPVNDYSLYSTSQNQLDVEVMASASGAAVATATVQKDAGGAEAAD